MREVVVTGNARCAGNPQIARRGIMRPDPPYTRRQISPFHNGLPPVLTFSAPKGIGCGPVVRGGQVFLLPRRPFGGILLGAWQLGRPAPPPLRVTSGQRAPIHL